METEGSNLLPFSKQIGHNDRRTITMLLSRIEANILFFSRSLSLSSLTELSSPLTNNFFLKSKERKMFYSLLRRLQPKEGVQGILMRMLMA